MDRAFVYRIWRFVFLPDKKWFGQYVITGHDLYGSDFIHGTQRFEQVPTGGYRQFQFGFWRSIVLLAERLFAGLQ